MARTSEGHTRDGHSVTGAAGVFADLKRGAAVVVKTAGKETSQTVGHKYGDQAGKVAGDSLSAAGNTATVVAVS
jgi:hypothetical protein